MTKLEDPVSLVAERRKAVEARRAELRSELHHLEAELLELVTAERVFQRLTGIQTEEEETEAGKPDNIPSMPEMIISALEEVMRSGSQGLQPAGIASFIRAKWWPEVQINNVGPIAWRMWKRNQLRKDGPIYALPNEKAPTQMRWGLLPSVTKRIRPALTSCRETRSKC